LDIGSGDGKISSLLFNHRFTYGIDNGEANDYLESIKYKRYKKVFLESAAKMSLLDNSVNFAFSNSVLEHIPNLRAVLKETSRVLNKGGYFVFTSPSKYFRDGTNINPILNKIGIGWINKLYSRFRNNALNHYNLHDHKYYTKELKKYGFEVIDYSYAISESTLKLWDTMAIIIKITAVFGINIEKEVTKYFLFSIRKHYRNSVTNKKIGMNLLIVAIKR